MTKSLLVAAGCLLIATAAWAGPPPGPQGSGNNVNTAFNNPPPTSTPAQSNKVQMAVPGSGNNVSTALATPAPAQPAPAASANMNANASANAAPMARPFNAGAYASASDCLTAASAAHQSLGLCAGMKK